MNSLLTDNVWFSPSGTRLHIINESGGVVYYKYTKVKVFTIPSDEFIIHNLTCVRFFNDYYCISKLEETLLGRLERLSEYCVYPDFMWICISNPKADLSKSYVILGKKVSLNSLALMTDLEFEEILITLTFTPNLL